MSCLLLKNARQALIDPECFEVENYIDILIENNLIKKVGKNLIIDKPCKIIDCTDKIVLPGFINLHHHFYQVLTRNIPKVQNAKLFDWLIYLYEIWKNLDEEAIYYSTKVALIELALTGCTYTSDHLYVFPKAIKKNFIDIQFEVAKELGIRFHPTRGAMSLGKANGGLPPDQVVQTEDEILEDFERLINKYHNSNKYSMARLSLAPCSPFSVTEKLMKQTIEFARKKKIKCHTHLAETLDEEKFCIHKFGLRPLEYMEKVGWIGPDVWFAHGIFFNDNELDLLAKTRTGISHCPTSNMRLGSGYARVPEMLKKNILVGLGVDGSASNDSSNMLRELKNTLLIHRIPY